MAFPHDYHRDLLGDFLDAVENGGEPRITGDEALKVHFLIDALLESGRSGQRVAVRERCGGTRVFRKNQDRRYV
jgi:UDP-N-acetyl-2-amino-2-deoxyglucuronate dehydrogenase